MNILESQNFYFAAIALIILMSFSVPILDRSTWFGIINLFAAGVLLGWKIAAGGLVASAVLWSVLQGYQFVRKKWSETTALRVLLFIYAASILQFIFYKSYIDRSASINWGLKLATNFDFAQLALTFMVAISFSYVVLRIIDVMRSVSQGRQLLAPIALSGYLFPFFMLPAGPIAAYDSHITLDSSPPRQLSMTAVIQGISTITSGLFLKIVVAESLRIVVMGLNDPLPTESILQTAYFLLYLYIDFAGYSLVALGIGRLAGIPTPKNFNLPFLAKNVTNFWARWHISLGDFTKRHIFIPTQVNIVRRFGIKTSYWANLLALELSFAFTGIWHRISISLLIWGALNGILVALEKIVNDRFKHTHLARSPTAKAVLTLLGPIYTLTAITLTLHIAINDMIQR